MGSIPPQAHNVARKAMQALGLAAIVLAAATAAAEAKFTICNQSLDVFNVAIGHDSGRGEIETEGWWQIAANRCVDVVREDLTYRYIYVYAKDVFDQPVLEGKTAMCVGTRRFQISGTGDCWQRGYEAVNFVEVDTQDQSRWTLFLTSERQQ
ncbi:putative integral membrane protein [Hartmannibacter diazotrophicus]|uniref:Putative integral membrane protein n=1 Tax=Hartmannibacter diazotrophicus TaxID=1482074 RepID=A0A2C9D6D8_9HYPH|nr:DUF1036 domain-containing protein [Hartmannibacter diazotrophicus]SON55892.1 putative integral membrane protein [Hartmannibacter diazotrophicus]